MNPKTLVLFLPLAACAPFRASNSFDTRPYLVTQAAALKPQLTPAEWTRPSPVVPSEGPRVDGVGPLHDVALDGQEAIAFHGPGFGSRAALDVLDASSGAPLWTRPLEANSFVSNGDLGVVKLIATHPTIVVQAETPFVCKRTPCFVPEHAGPPTIYGFDRATGKELYREPPLGGEVEAFAEALGDQSLLVKTLAKPTVATLRAFDLVTGVARWSADVPARMLPGTQLAGGQLLVVGDKAHGIDWATGQVSFSLELGGTGAPVAHASDTWLVSVRDASTGITTLLGIDHAGHQRFRHPVGRPSATVVAADAGPTIIVDDGLGVVAIQARDGATVWSTPTKPEPHVGRAIVDGTRIGFTTATAAVSLDVATGKELSRSPLPSGFDGGRLPDRFVSRSGRAIWIGEAAVAAYDQNTGGLAFSVSVKGRHTACYSVAAKGRLRAELALHQPTRKPGGLGTTSTGALKVAAALSTSTTAIAATSIAEIGGAVAAQERMGADAQVARIERQSHILTLRLANAIELHAASVQGGFFVTPIEWLWGAGVFVLDLDDGTWAEAVTGPVNTFSDSPDAHFPLARLSADGSRVYTRAVNRDPTTWHLESPSAAYLRPTDDLFSLRMPVRRPLDQYDQASVVRPNSEITFDTTQF